MKNDDTSIYYSLLYVLIIISALQFGCGNTDEKVKLYQRVGRPLVLLESEFERSHEVINQSFESRDSSANVEAIFLDTIEKTDDTIIIKYDYLAALSGGVEIPLTAPHENIFSYIGKQLPDFALPDLEGNMIRFNTFLGKPIVLNFWFRACTPCKREMPRLNEIREQYKDKVNFVAICLDDIAELKGFFKYYDFEYEHLIDGRDLAEQLGIAIYPKNIVINKNGQVSQIMDALLETIDADGNRITGEGNELIREIERVL